jgi:hypothetical protein
MLVFNLTEKELKFRGKPIPPNGGSNNYPELDPPRGFIPNRDRKLEAQKVIAFGQLPKWWVLEQSLKEQKGPFTIPQTARRDDVRVEVVKEKLAAGVAPALVLADAVAGKITDELRTESQVRSMFPVTPLPDKSEKKRR